MGCWIENRPQAKWQSGWVAKRLRALKNGNGKGNSSPLDSCWQLNELCSFISSEIHIFHILSVKLKCVYQQEWFTTAFSSRGSPHRRCCKHGLDAPVLISGLEQALLVCACSLISIPKCLRNTRLEGWEWQNVCSFPSSTKNLFFLKKHHTQY